jgi:hypothetical protein
MAYDKDGYYVEGDEYDDLDDDFDYKAEALAEKKRKALAAKPKPKKKKKSLWGSMFSGDTSAISKRRKALEDSLKY